MQLGSLQKAFKRRDFMSIGIVDQRPYLNPFMRRCAIGSLRMRLVALTLNQYMQFTQKALSDGFFALHGI